jgi:type 1 glutamine amidotransferase/sugar phosphate isomerase/epimerase
MRLIDNLRVFCLVTLFGFLLVGLTVEAGAQETPKATPKPARPAFVIPPDQRVKIEQAIPAEAPARPKQPRKLLIFDVNVGYGGHPSRFHANLAFTLMGKKTGAFETVISRDPAVFERESLKQFDAVFLNNTVGNLFEDPKLRKNLMEFVVGGGGLLGVHGTSVAFTRWPGAHETWPEFGVMLGARGASHRDSKEHVFFHFDDPQHPLNQPLPKSFDYRDEFFRVHEPYSRDRVRVLFSIDNEKTDAERGGPDRGPVFREDNDYALAWVRNYGRGRVFYCTIAHNPYVFWDPTMLRFYLGAVQFALGDLPAPTLPSNKLTPPVRAREKLGWRLGITAYGFHKYPFFEAIDKTAELGLSYIGGLSFQKVRSKKGSGAVAGTARRVLRTTVPDPFLDHAGNPKNFDPGLSDDELRQVRLKLDSAGVRMVTYYIHLIPADEAGCRKVFEFGRKMGIETFISEPLPEALDTIEKFCDEYDINVAIHNHGPDASPVYWRPEGILEVCRGRSKRLGACGDLGYWMRSGIDPLEAVRTLGDRLITLQLHDLNELTAEGHDVPWGSGVGKTEEFVKEIHRLGVKPTLFGLEYSYDWFDSMPEMSECIKFFDEISVELAR